MQEVKMDYCPYKPGKFLLLGVTAASMAIAKQGLPPLGLLIPTLFGGAMTAGSANCLNCYIDRDIDQIMGRTQRRSLPSGRVEPQHSLVFGIILGIGSFAIFVAFVNLLSAVFSCSAILSKKWVRTLFWYSNMYLAAIFAIMVLDRVIH